MRIFSLGEREDIREDIREEVTIFVSLRYKSLPGVRRRVAQWSDWNNENNSQQLSQSQTSPASYCFPGWQIYLNKSRSNFNIKQEKLKDGIVGP